MNNNEEIIIINGNDVVINHSPVRMYDSTGAYVGKGTLDDVIKQELWCRSVHAWIVNSKGEIYLHQRSFKVLNNPGKWSESFGGYVDGDDSEEETLATEMSEEIGLQLSSAQKVEKLGEIRQLETRFDGSVSQQFVSVFLVTFDFDETNITLSNRDVLQGRTVPWRVFKKELEEGKIDFVDHLDEIALVFRELGVRYL